ncbi:hypothetical protein ACFX13_038612 [Malus domestica]
MATNASGFFTAPTVPSQRRKIQPSIRIFGSGFRSPEESPRGYSAPALLKAQRSMLELPLLNLDHPSLSIKAAS